MRSSRDCGISPFCGSSSFATGSTSSMAKRRACSWSFSRSGVCHGGSSTGGCGSQVSSVELIGVLLAEGGDHLHLGRPRFPAHAVVTRDRDGRHEATRSSQIYQQGVKIAVVAVAQRLDVTLRLVRNAGTAKLDDL